MDGIAAATKAADDGRHHPTAPEAGHLGPDDADAADRLRAGTAPPGDGGAAPAPLLAPPSPDAVVAVSLRHAAAPEERAREREAALRARHAAEVARLRAALRAMEEAHAAKVARLRAEHAADTAGLRWAVEATLRALDAARTGAEPPSDLDGGDAPGLKAAPSAARQRATIRKRLARLTGRGGGDPMGSLGRPAAKPSAGADMIAAVRALLPAGAASLSRLRGAALPPPR
jgi:hypothetical protein